MFNPELKGYIVVVRVEKPEINFVKLGFESHVGVHGHHRHPLTSHQVDIGKSGEQLLAHGATGGHARVLTAAISSGNYI